jgi:cation transport ATPase
MDDRARARSTGPGAFGAVAQAPEQKRPRESRHFEEPEQETYGSGIVAETLHEQLQIGRRDTVDREEDEVDQAEAEIGHSLFHGEAARSLCVSPIAHLRP